MNRLGSLAAALLIFLTPAFAGSTPAQSVVLNEVMAVNTTAHPDIVDFEDYPDWIELKNTTDQPVSLDGFLLSDDPADPAKWAFPPGASIPAHGYFVVWADGHDAGPGENHPRGYWPWRSFTSEGYHTSFALSGEGETVVLSASEGGGEMALITAASPAPLAPAPVSRWRYLGGQADPGHDWITADFDDSLWAFGIPQFGYGDGDEATVIDAGPRSNNHPITSYYRSSFTLDADPSGIGQLALRLLVDDGAVIYLNGREIVRHNMPAGPISNGTEASDVVSGGDENLFHDFKISPSLLVPRTNILAVEIHQSGSNSSDVSFDLGLVARVRGIAHLIESVTFPKQVPDVSYGRDPQDPSQWRQMAHPTPGSANEGPFITDLRQTSGKVTVSLPAGFHTGTQTVNLSAAAGEIRYTLDGSLPRAGSSLFAGPISIVMNTVLRARSFEPGKVPGPVETRTFFIDEQPGSIPMVSFSGDPETLFGDRIGIYYNQHEPVSSGNDRLRDVYKDKEIPSSVEFFEPDGKLAFRVNAGATIGAENSWVVAQRPVNIHLRSKFGDDSIHYDLFPGSTLADHTFITFRNGGDNWDTDMLKDALLPFIAESQLRTEAQAYRPVLMFINGAYWGIHELRQKYDTGWFNAKYHLLPGGYDHLGYAHVDSPELKLDRIEGTTNRWGELLAFLDTHDLNEPANWAQVEAEIDLDSFIDFIAVEAYVINISWRHNREFWRAHAPGSKWQWLVPDIDRSFNVADIYGSGELDGLIAEDPVMHRLVTSSQFKARLAQRFAAHLASTFAPSRLVAIVDRLDKELTAEVPRHAARWGPDGGMTVQKRTEALKAIREFTRLRPDFAFPDLAKNLGLGGTHQLELAIDGPEGGRVQIANVPVPAGSIRLFANLPFELKAEATPGFKFAGWTGASNSVGVEPIVLTLQADAALTAHFVPSGETLLADHIEGDTTLVAAISPYTFLGNLTVHSNANLTIDPGVELRVPPGAHIRVQGSLNLRGTQDRPILITGRDATSWGGISFERASGTSVLSHTSIQGATRGIDPSIYPSAISGLDSHLVMEFLDLTKCAGPVFVRGGSTILRDSVLHNPFSGDGINVKGGFAEVSRCTFLGNNAPDTDAIDFDGVVNGIIRDNRIYRFVGSNSDGIDCGEECVNLLIEGNRIYFNSDKGISVGQGSTVTLRHNLIVGCTLGAGVKDAGSLLTADQNTFVGNQIAVAVYEKNFGDGGGRAVLVNNLLSRSAVAPVTVDGYSSLELAYSLSDTVPIPGVGNLFADPQFPSAATLNFELPADSPARDAGDPSHPLDPDGSRADIGAGYRYSAEDYPYPLRETVVINEVLANSESGGDWIELHNRTANSIDLSGWFLSDSGSNLKKYRIAPGTVIPAGGYLVFSEHLHFGDASMDEGRLVAFALDDSGEKVHLSSAINETLTGYESQESFGPSLPGVSLGAYYKPETDSYNFVPLAVPTPGAPNAGPRVGPIVISEIFYAPKADSETEFIELFNISPEPVTMYDADRGTPWMMTDGIEFSFPTNAPVTFAAAERVVLVRNLDAFTRRFGALSGTRVFEWTSGKLDNSGETLQLAQPGPLNESNVVQFARIDRVNYDSALPWPALPDVGEFSLNRINERGYGNSFLNWELAAPTPGFSSSGNFQRWVASAGFPADQRGENDDPDLDGVPNLVEFALGSNPMQAESTSPMALTPDGLMLTIEFPEAPEHDGVVLVLESANELGANEWTPVTTTVVAGRRHVAIDPHELSERYFRLRARRTAAGN